MEYAYASIIVRKAHADQVAKVLRCFSRVDSENITEFYAEAVSGEQMDAICEDIGPMEIPFWARQEAVLGVWGAKVWISDGETVAACDAGFGHGCALNLNPDGTVSADDFDEVKKFVDIYARVQDRLDLPRPQFAARTVTILR